MSELYFPEEVAVKLRVNLETVYRWLRVGTLRGTKLGGKRKLWRISSEALDEFLKKGESKSDESSK